jgi:very-short-patch-repair endonuclease
VIEVDGSQHMEGVHLQRDKRRDESMVDLDLKVLRFDSRVVLTETDAIVEAIFQIMTERLSRNLL